MAVQPAEGFFPGMARFVNMKTFKRFLSIAVLFCLPARLSALDLDGCVKMALASSHSLKASQLRIEASRAAYSKDRKSLLPSLTVTGEDGYNRYQAEAGLRDGLTGQVGAQFSWELGKNLAGFPETSRLELEKALLERDLSEKDVIRGVTQDYYRLYILLGKRADYAEARSYFSSHIEDIEKLETAGLDVKLDRVRAEIQLKALELTGKELETGIAGALKSLSYAAGAELRAEDLVFDGGAGAFGRLPSIDGGSLAASTCCPDAEVLLSARLDRLETSSALEVYRQSKFAYAPVLALGLTRNLDIIDPATELYRTYVAVSLPLFDFGARGQERKALLRGYEARRETELESRRQRRLALETLAAEIESAAASYAGLRKNYEAAAGNVETAKLYYAKGKLKETDLLSIFSEYLDAKQQSRDALGRYLDKKAELAYLRAEAVK